MALGGVLTGKIIAMEQFSVMASTSTKSCSVGNLKDTTRGINSPAVAVLLITVPSSAATSTKAPTSKVKLPVLGNQPTITLPISVMSIATPRAMPPATIKSTSQGKARKSD